MKVLLAAINAKYIHTSLAVRSLSCYAEHTLAQRSGAAGKPKKPDIAFAEYTINQREEDILADLYTRKPDVLCVSCYLWNFRQVCHVTENLHRILPRLSVWLGGPEVSFDAENCLEKMPQITGIMVGEGEQSFTELVSLYDGEAVPDQEDFSKVPGIVYRGGDGRILRTAPAPLLSMDEIPFVYREENLEAEDIRHRILYYETSRGCPFSCSYCLSSIEEKVRLRGRKLVAEELQFFLDRKVPQVKFVDRTFNCNHSHAMFIWRYLKEHDNQVTNFHFEIGADLLTEEEIALLNTLRPGQVQLEIGVQTTNPAVIREISRTMKLDVLKRNVAAIKRGGNIHQHLDLIAGLPGEGIDSFRKSFNEVYAMEPDQLQLGFLKVLKGSAMYRKAETYGITASPEPPYEVLQTPWLSFADILRLKGVESMLEVYGNSRQFDYTLRFLIPLAGTPFDFFERLSDYYRKQNLYGKNFSRLERFEILRKFARGELLKRKTDGMNMRNSYPSEEKKLDEYLVFDLYLRENSKKRPEWAESPEAGREFARKVTDQMAEEEKERKGCSRRSLAGHLHGERFRTDVLRTGQEGPWYVLFDYRDRNPLDGNAKTTVYTYSKGKFLPVPGNRQQVKNHICSS